MILCVELFGCAMNTDFRILAKPAGVALLSLYSLFGLSLSSLFQLQSFNQHRVFVDTFLSAVPEPTLTSYTRCKPRLYSYLAD